MAASEAALLALELPHRAEAGAASRKALTALNGSLHLVSEARLTDAQLLVSELVTNAVRHGDDRGEPIRVRVTADEEVMRIEFGYRAWLRSVEPPCAVAWPDRWLGTASGRGASSPLGCRGVRPDARVVRGGSSAAASASGRFAHAAPVRAGGGGSWSVWTGGARLERATSCLKAQQLLPSAATCRSDPCRERWAAHICCGLPLPKRFHRNLLLSHRKRWWATETARSPLLGVKRACVDRAQTL